MDSLLVLITGALIALMVSVNGGLTASFGVFPAAAIIHAVGTAFALALCFWRKKTPPVPRGLPAWLFLGGIIGVATTACNNFAFGRISTTSLVALGLLGQSAASLAADRYGLFGLPKRPAQKAALPGIAVSFAGMALMLGGGDSLPAALLSFAAGVCIVLSRTVNARLAGRVGALRGSLINHLTGLPVTLALALALPGGGTGGAARPWDYLGGVLGVCVVMLLNVTVPRVAAWRLTALNFLGQLLTGAALDLAAGRGLGDASFRGGAVIAFGMLLSFAMERAAQKRQEKEAACRARLRDIEEAHRRELLEKYGGGAV